MITEFKNKKLFILCVLIAIFSSLVLFEFSSKAQVVDDETQEKLEELEEKAQKYKDIIEVKQKQQESLNNQILIMDANIGKYETEIQINKRKIDEISSRMARKQAEIRDKEENIIFQKKILSDLLRTMYNSQESDILTAVLLRENLDPFLSGKDSMSQVSRKINETLDTLKSAKQRLEEEKLSLEGDKTTLTKVHIDLTEKSTNLESTKSFKQDLLSQTQGEEDKYQKLLAKVEAQKLELLNIDELYAISGLSVDDFPKPDSKYFASTSWYYSQRDSRWGNVRIGNSKSLLKDYGCAVSSVAMVFTNLGNSITPENLAQKDQYFQWDLIAWPKTWKNITLASSGSSHGNISWSTIDRGVKNGFPVIVYIGKSGNSGGHYVVIHHKDNKGKYVVHDPYFGANIFLDTSRALVGAMGTNTSTYMDQMILYQK